MQLVAPMVVEGGCKYRYCVCDEYSQIRRCKCLRRVAEGVVNMPLILQLKRRDGYDVMYDTCELQPLVLLQSTLSNATSALFSSKKGREGRERMITNCCRSI